MLIFKAILYSLLWVQLPQDVPGPENNTPIDLSSWVDITIYIILPIIVVILYILYRRMKKKNK